MFTKVLVSSMMFISSFAFAAELQCEITKDVVTQYACKQCAETNGDNDCVQEIETTCSYEKSISVLKTNQSVGSEFFISDKAKEASFFISQGPSGHSIKLSYIDGSQASYFSASKLDLSGKNTGLGLKTKAAAQPGNVTALTLTCKAAFE